MAVFWVFVFFFGWETHIDVSKVPPKVMQSAQQALLGVTIDSASMEQENGVLFYELRAVYKGKHYEIEISEHGEVVEIELQDGVHHAITKPVEIKDIPDSIVDQLQHLAPGFQPGEVELKRLKGESLFEIEGTLGKRELEFEFTEAGVLISLHVRKAHE